MVLQNLENPNLKLYLLMDIYYIVDSLGIYNHSVMLLSSKKMTV